MNNMNHRTALWDCFGFHIVQVGNMLPNQATLPDWAFDDRPGRVISS